MNKLAFPVVLFVLFMVVPTWSFLLISNWEWIKHGEWSVVKNEECYSYRHKRWVNNDCYKSYNEAKESMESLKKYMEERGNFRNKRNWDAVTK